MREEKSMTAPSTVNQNQDNTQGASCPSVLCQNNGTRQPSSSSVFVKRSGTKIEEVARRDGGGRRNAVTA